MTVQRTVFELVGTTDDEMVIRVEESTIDIEAQRASLQRPIGQMPSRNWGSDDSVRQHGNEVFERVTSHPDVKEIFQIVRHLPIPHPIYFRLLGVASEKHYWETAWNSSVEFLSLTAKHPIGRIPKTRPVENKPKVFSGELRILAILSAQDSPAVTQYEALVEATEQAVGIDVKLHLLIGENPLLDRVKDEGHANVASAEPIPQNTGELANILEEIRPNIIHFYCHGSVKGGIQELLIASNLDWEQSDREHHRPLSLPPSKLVMMARNTRAFESTWMIVMNCCDTGLATDKKNSIAHHLVANNVVSTTIGMLERIDELTAELFAKHFYSRLYSEISSRHDEIVQQYATSDSSVARIGVLEWTHLMPVVRNVLGSMNGNVPENDPEWAFPVLYVRHPDFQIQVVRATEDPDEEDRESIELDDAMESRVQTVAEALVMLRGNPDLNLRIQILNLLGEEPAVPRKFWPDEFGSFRENAK